MDEVVEGEVVEEGEVQEGTEVAVRQPAVTPATLADAQSVEAMIARVEKIQLIRERVMRKDVHYGIIPGTDKPALYKPGAEILAQTFMLDMQLSHTKTWHPDGHMDVDAVCEVFHAPTGTRLGRASAFCSTRESKYAYRQGQLVCPECGQPQVRRSKHDDEFYCWRKQGGCGETFSLDDARITSQKTGRIPNPDLPDTMNTVIKMAEKRALVAGALITTGASSDFTQDIEDGQPDPDTGSAGADEFAEKTGAQPETRQTGGQPAVARSWKELWGWFEEKQIDPVFVQKLFWRAMDRTHGVDVSKYADLKTDRIDFTPMVFQRAHDLLRAATAAYGDLAPTNQQLVVLFGAVWPELSQDAPAGSTGGPGAPAEGPGDPGVGSGAPGDTGPSTGSDPRAGAPAEQVSQEADGIPFGDDDEEGMADEDSEFGVATDWRDELTDEERAKL